MVNRIAETTSNHWQARVESDATVARLARLGAQNDRDRARRRLACGSRRRASARSLPHPHADSVSYVGTIWARIVADRRAYDPLNDQVIVRADAMRRRLGHLTAGPRSSEGQSMPRGCGVLGTYRVRLVTYTGRIISVVVAQGRHDGDGATADEDGVPVPTVDAHPSGDGDDRRGETTTSYEALKVARWLWIDVSSTTGKGRPRGQVIGR